MKYKIKVYSIMEYGQRVDANGNPHQEDCMFPPHGRALDTDRVFVVCDGMGGHEAGEVASATVCEAMSKSVLENSNPEGEFTDEMLAKAISDAFDALDKKDTGAVKKMGTTMTFLKLHDKGCTIAHMGDSRVYHIRPGHDEKTTEILFETVDHSLVNDLVRIGELTPEEAKTSRQRNVITRAMQPNMERRPRADVYHTADIKPGDYFYMCTDGMLENADDENIKYVFSDEQGNAETKVEILTKGTAFNRDNHPAIIVHVVDVIDPLPVGVGDEEVDVAVATSGSQQSVSENNVAMPSPKPHVASRARAAGEMANLTDAQLDKKNKKKALLNFGFLIASLVVVAVVCFIVFFNPSQPDADNPSAATPVHEQPQRPVRQPQPVQSQQQPPRPVASQPAPQQSQPVADEGATAGDNNVLQDAVEEIQSQASATQQPDTTENDENEQIDENVQTAQQAIGNRIQGAGSGGADAASVTETAQDALKNQNDTPDYQ